MEPENYWRKAEIRRWFLYVGLENASKRLLKETVYPFHSLKIWKSCQKLKNYSYAFEPDQTQLHCKREGD